MPVLAQELRCLPMNKHPQTLTFNILIQLLLLEKPIKQNQLAQKHFCLHIQCYKAATASLQMTAISCVSSSSASEPPKPACVFEKGALIIN